MTTSIITAKWTWVSQFLSSNFNRNKPLRTSGMGIITAH